MFSRLKDMQPKHWLLLAGFLAAVSGVLSGYHSWHEVLQPGAVSGFLGLLAVQISSLFTGAPPKND